MQKDIQALQSRYSLTIRLTASPLKYLVAPLAAGVPLPEQPEKAVTADTSAIAPAIALVYFFIYDPPVNFPHKWVFANCYIYYYNKSAVLQSINKLQ